MMTRRELLMAATAGTVVAAGCRGEQDSGRGLLGGSPTTFSVRAKAARLNNQQFDIIQRCHELGLAGAESILRPRDAEQVKAIRRWVDDFGMVVILNTPLPKSESDLGDFDAAVAACKESGASALHAAMTGRRYEQFGTLAEFKANFAQCQRSVALAEPVLQRHRLRLAIENHKGWRASEQAAWMKRVSSEWVGVCLDMGNNLSLCEMPDETFEALTPFAIFSHIKDMGLEDYPDGFLLSEVPFGEGVIDLRQRVEQLRRKDPTMLFCLEMITRNPLKIPLFTDRYWASFSDTETAISGQDVAKVLALVRKNQPKKPLAMPERFTPAEQLKAEDDNNLACIQYARKNLNM